MRGLTPPGPLTKNNEVWNGHTQGFRYDTAQVHDPDPLGQKVEFGAVWDGIEPVETEDNEISKKGYDYKPSGRKLNVASHFKKKPSGDLTIAIKTDSVDKKGYVMPMYLGDSEFFKGDGPGGSRTLKIIYNEIDFPGLPPVYIPGYKLEAKEGYMKAIPNDGSTPLNIKIYSKSADGKKKSIGNDKLKKLSLIQDAVVFSNELKRERSYGDPVSGEVDIMAGINFFGRSMNHHLDIRDSMPLAREGDDATAMLRVDLSNYLRLVPPGARGIKVRCDQSRFGDRPPLVFFDGNIGTHATAYDSAVNFRSPIGDYQGVNAGFEADVGGGRILSLHSTTYARYAEYHNNYARSIMSAAPSSSPEPEASSVVTEGQGRDL